MHPVSLTQQGHTWSTSSTAKTHKYASGTNNWMVRYYVRRAWSCWKHRPTFLVIDNSIATRLSLLIRLHKWTELLDRNYYSWLCTYKHLGEWSFQRVKCHITCDSRSSTFLITISIERWFFITEIQDAHGGQNTFNYRLCEHFRFWVETKYQYG